MVDQPDLSSPAAPLAVECDHALFTSLPSPTGEGYRLVGWSSGVRPEERTELTRCAPSHGSLCGEGAAARALVLFHFKSTGRRAYGFTRIAGAEHTRRGGGRVWTDFLIVDASDLARTSVHPCILAAALAAAAPAKTAAGASLNRLSTTVAGSSIPDAEGIASAAATSAIASLLMERRSCVVATGSAPVRVLEDALRMIPAVLRAGVDACAGLRFSPARGVLVTLVERLDFDTTRATRGQGVECIDTAKSPLAADGRLAPWLRLMVRWWESGRAGDAVRLADHLAAGWTVEDILDVAAVCEAIDRDEEKPEALGSLLSRRSAA